MTKKNAKELTPFEVEIIKAANKVKEYKLSCEANIVSILYKNPDLYYTYDNIDLKSFNTEYYKSLCGGSLNPVLKTIEIASRSCHVEITTLLVSGENDRLEEVEDIAKFLSSIDEEIPLHLSRYFPSYKLKNPPTDINFMRKAEEVAKKHLINVTLGNI